MTQFDIVLTDTPTDADHAAIDGGLADFNAEQAGYRDWRELAVLARDPATGQTIGGILGRTSLGLLFVDLVYRKRGKSVGTQVPHTPNANDQIGDRNKNIGAGAGQAGRSRALT
jgi:hypothetical protein